MLLSRSRPLMLIIRIGPSSKHLFHNIRCTYDLIELRSRLIRIK
jgi:hypothetical protein